jgi:hypothetical protein
VCPENYKLISGRNAAILVTQFHLKDPLSLWVYDLTWPLYFAAYLLYPYDTLVISKENRLIRKGVDISLPGLTIRGSGALTGDFGYSSVRRPTAQVTDIIGPGLHLIFTALISLVLTFMYVALVQSIGRPATYHTYSNKLPARNKLPALADTRYMQPANYRRDM